MDDLMLPLPGLSPVCGKSVVARFDGGCLSSDAGVLVLREIEQRLGVAERLAGCIADPRAQAQVVHGLAEMIRFRMLMIASGYEVFWRFARFCVIQALYELLSNKYPM